MKVMECDCEEKGCGNIKGWWVRLFAFAFAFASKAIPTELENQEIDSEKERERRSWDCGVSKSNKYYLGTAQTIQYKLLPYTIFFLGFLLFSFLQKKEKKKELRLVDHNLLF